MVKKKSFSILIAMLLVTSMVFPMLLLRTDAHTPPWNVPTYTYISVSPNPVGVGQTVNVNFWVNTPPPNIVGSTGDRWQNLTVIITKPDGTTTKLGTYVSDTTGGTFTTYSPTAVGNYTFKAYFSGQTLTNGAITPPGAPNPALGDYFMPSESEVFRLTVQSDSIQYPTENPYPTEYWTRPIYAVNNNWYPIAGNWMGAGWYNATGNYNPYSTAPLTSHILWTRPEAFGGTIGGEYGGDQQSNFYSTRQYEQMFQPIILNGILYYTVYPGSATYPEGWAAVNLRTGETIWTSNTPLTLPNAPRAPATVHSAGPCTILRCGQILNYVSMNQYGGLAYLWSTGTPAMVAQATNIAAGSTTYNMFDAMTGNYILSVVNGTGFSALVQDPNGDLIGYFVNSSTANQYKAPTLNAWNSTKALYKYGYDMFAAMGLDVWRPNQGAIIPFSDGIEWSKPLANNMSNTGAPITLSYAGISTGVVMMMQYGTTGGANAFQYGWIIEAGYSADTGQLLWGPINRTQNVGTRVAFGATGNGNAGCAIGNGHWVEVDINTFTITGFNLLTGAQIWGPIKLPDPNPWDSLGMQEIVAGDSIYIWGLGGDVYSIDLDTGKINWHYKTPDGGYESPYGTEALWTSTGKGVIAGGVLFISEGHEFAPPLYHGAKQLALNTTTGELIWSIEAANVNGAKAVVEGILVALNAYDNQIYGYGQGPSKTTVTAPLVGVTTSTPVTITGTVTDISAGSKQEATATNFPNGLPCVSDASMTGFMEAVYMQQQMPNNVTGVPVVISVIDSNGNFRQIGTTTTDASGTYALTWTPDISGQYAVTTTFEGSGAYYGSSANTYFYANEQTATPTPTQPLEASIIEQYFVPAVAGIAVLIVASFVITILVLRKRP